MRIEEKQTNIGNDNKQIYFSAWTLLHTIIFFSHTDTPIHYEFSRKWKIQEQIYFE